MMDPMPSVGGESSSSEFMLFSVRVKVDPMRKSASMSNLSDYEAVIANGNKKEPLALPASGGAAVGYASADDSAPKRNRARKRGTPWTEEEHKLFLHGLQKAGKGDWKGISRNYVKTRTPTQVASHAQKYFLKQVHNVNRPRRRSSLLDMTIDSVVNVNKKKLESNPAENLLQAAVNPTANNSSATMVDLNIDEEKVHVDSPCPLSLQISPSSVGLNLTLTRDNSSLSVA